MRSVFQIYLLRFFNEGINDIDLTAGLHFARDQFLYFGSLLLAPSLVNVRLAALSRETLALVVFLGVFGGAVAFTLWTIALRRLSPTQVAVYINLNPIAASLLAAMFLGERLTPVFAVGFVAVAAGVLIVNWTASSARP